MNANQLINMVINRVMRIAINKGVGMSIKGASQVAGKMRKPTHSEGEDVYIDDFGNEVKRRDKPRS